MCWASFGLVELPVLQHHCSQVPARPVQTCQSTTIKEILLNPASAEGVPKPKHSVGFRCSSRNTQHARRTTERPFKPTDRRILLQSDGRRARELGSHWGSDRSKIQQLCTNVPSPTRDQLISIQLVVAIKVDHLELLLLVSHHSHLFIQAHQQNT